MSLITRQVPATIERPASVPADLIWRLIVNLPERQFEVYADPSGLAESPEYRERQDYGTSDTVPVVIEGREVGRLAVRELLP